MVNFIITALITKVVNNYEKRECQSGQMGQLEGLVA